MTAAIAELINSAGRVGIVGVWPLKDPSGVEPSLEDGNLMVAWSKLFGKNMRITMGRNDDERCNGKLRDMIITGAAKLSIVVSHRLSIDDAPDAFPRFDTREEGYIKVVLKP